MILALVSSGRAFSAFSAPTKRDLAASPVEPIVSTSPEPPSAAAFSKAVVRTVSTSFLSLVFTVAIALPA
ncbi:hypothetical protein SPZE110945_19445 [Sphingomonas zeae]